MTFLAELSKRLVAPNRIEMFYYEPKFITSLGRSDGGILDDEFRAGFLKYDFTDLPEDYVKSANRLYMVSEAGVIGGVLFQAGVTKFRTLQVAPQAFGMRDLCYLEMNGLWMASETSEFSRIGFWGAIVDFLLMHYASQTKVIFSYDTKKTALSPFYQWIAPETIYEGPVAVIEGMDPERTTEERIAQGTIARFEELLPEFMIKRLEKFRKQGVTLHKMISAE
jgi:hypothetical protein